MSAQKFPKIISSKLRKIKYDYLDNNLKEIVKTIFKEIKKDDYVSIIKIYGCKLKIIKISFNKTSFLVSILKEKIETLNDERIDIFIDSLTRYGIDKDTIDSFLLFHWSDKTLNNTGKTRYKVREMYNLYPERLNHLNIRLNTPRIKHLLLNRYLFHINKKPLNINYVMYEDEGKYRIIQKEDFINILMDKKGKQDSIHVGPILIQSVKKNITRRIENEKQRKYIKFVLYDYINILKEKVL